MSEWKEYKLEEVIDTFIDYRGKTPKKSKSGVPLVTAKVVKAGKILAPNEFIPIEKYEKWMSRGFPKQNDIVLTTEAPLGEVALIKDENIALAQRIITMRGKPGLVSNVFLKYYLQSDQGQYELDSRASGTTVFGIKASVLKKVPVFLPPIPEQCGIASVLSSLDDKIDLLHRQNQTLEQMAETLFRQWFVEEADEGWEEGVLSDILDLNPSYQLQKGKLAPYLEMKNVSSNTFNPEGWYDRQFTSGMRFQNGDTLLARITPCLENGKSCHVAFLEDNEIGWGSTEYIVMRMKDPFHPFTSYLIAKSPDFRDFAISSMSGSSGRQRAQANVLAEYPITIPSKEAITELNRQLDPFQRKLNSNATQIRTLTALRDTLLPKLMSGEVKIDSGNV
jgi:type I restriction enzyme S subunit